MSLEIELGRPRVSFPLPIGVGSSELQSYGYDPAQAKQLLQEAGFSPTQPPTLIYKTSTDPFRLRLATIIQEQLQQVGFDVSIHSHDWGTFYGDIKTGRFQMYSLAWVGLKTPDIFRQAFHSRFVPPQGVNRGHYADSSTDHLIDKIEDTIQRTEQQTLYHHLQERLLQTLPYVPLWYEDHFALSSKDIQGYTLQVDGNFDGLQHIQWATAPTPQSQTVRQKQSSWLSETSITDS